MGCSVWGKQISEVDKALNVLKNNGIDVFSNPFKILDLSRTKLLANIGVKLPRIVQLLVRFVGFSPGVIALYHDIESGFMSEARRTPRSEPAYHFVSDDIAVKILKHDISDELEEFLMTPDDNIDN